MLLSNVRSSSSSTDNLLTMDTVQKQMRGKISRASTVISLIGTFLIFKFCFHVTKVLDAKYTIPPFPYNYKNYGFRFFFFFTFHLSVEFDFQLLTV